MAYLILAGLLGLTIIPIVGRVAFVKVDQKREFDYHDNLQKSINLWSKDFEKDGLIPTEFTGLGEEKSPSLHWDNLPAETKSLVLTVVDYDGPSPSFKIFTIDHWVLFNVDPKIDHIDQAITLEELEKEGMNLGRNVNGEVDYVGPKPPLGTHKYYFRIYALSISSLDLDKPTRKALMEEIQNRVIAYGELVGAFRK